jgi:hypothetical protein
MWVLFWRIIHKVLAGEGDKPVFLALLYLKKNRYLYFLQEVR